MSTSAEYGERIVGALGGVEATTQGGGREAAGAALPGLHDGSRRAGGATNAIGRAAPHCD